MSAITLPVRSLAILHRALLGPAARARDVAEAEPEDRAQHARETLFTREPAMRWMFDQYRL